MLFPVMGAVNCPVHGCSIGTLVAPSLMAAVQDIRAVPREFVRTIRIDLGLGRQDDRVMRMWCDVPSAQAAGVPTDRVMNLEEAERYESYLRGFDLICGRCFSDWRRHAGLDASGIETETEPSD